MSDFYNKYPYTDFHELNLDWVIERVKQLTEDWISTKEAWEGTEADWQELYNYVHDYFNNLDVQEEINTKIDTMIANGSFRQIVTPIINEQVDTSVSAWLTAHVDPVGSAVVVDNTLSITGAAADAKVVGDNLRDITSEKMFELSSTLDMVAYVASGSNVLYPEGTIVTTGASNYRTRIVKVQKGSWIRATLGDSGSILPLSYVLADGTFVEKIVRGFCYNYHYQFDRDGYVAICTNITSGYNFVALYADELPDYSTTPELGWKAGYTSATAVEDVDNGNYVFDNAYGITHPIYVRPFDKISVDSVASSSVSVFEAVNKLGKYQRSNTGQDSNNLRTYSKTFYINGYVLISCKKTEIANFTISIERHNPAVDTSNYEENSAYTSVDQFTEPTMFGITSGVSDLPDSANGDMLVFAHNNQYVTQMLYQYSLKRLLIRLMGRNGSAYGDWIKLEEIFPDVNAIYSNLPTNKYASRYSAYTSMDQFVDAPFFGGITSASITDRPHNKNGVLVVLPHNSQYVMQLYYIYSEHAILLIRLLGRDGTPYNDWMAVGEPLFDKKVLGIGDSLMRGNNLSTSQTWLGLLASRYGITAYNKGINGASVAYIDSDNVGMVGRIDGFYSDVPVADYVVLIGGANDKRLNIPLGNDDSTDQTEFCGALNVIISKIRQYWPKAHIVFMTNYDRFPSLNSLNLTDIDYVEAMQRVCARQHVFCYDNYHNSGVNFDDTNFSAWADEGIYEGGSANRHFSPAAYEWLLPKYKALLEDN